MHLQKSIKEYLDALAARHPTPGGGSAAALSGALGTTLLEMVCNFTLGNEKYREAEPAIKKYCEPLANIRNEFSKLIDEDVSAYSEIRSAFKAKDKKNIDKALKGGYDICLNICKLSKEGLAIAQFLANKGNSNENLITDVGCGAELLNAAFNSGVFNCEINLKGIEDKDFTEKEKKILLSLGKESDVLYKNAVSKTRERMK